jgi:hypothetical protein
LNPFVENNDSLNITYGNPELGAQIIHNSLLSARLQKGKTFMGLTFGFAYSNNMIVTLQEINSATGVRSNTYANAGKDIVFSINGNVNAALSPKWNFNANLGSQYRVLKSTRPPFLSNSGIGGSTTAGINYVPSTRLSATTYVGFERGIIDLQAQQRAIPYCGTGVNYKFFKNTLTVGLMAQNYFASTYDYITTVQGVGFKTVQIYHNPFRKLVVTAQWSFGKLRESVSKRIGVTNDDLL